MRTRVMILSVLILVGAGCNRTLDETTGGFPDLSGPYLGQTPPGGEAELFAPGIVGTSLYTRDIAVAPGGKEIFYGVKIAGKWMLLWTREVDGRWTEPEVAPFSGEYAELEPAFSEDGSQLYYMSFRPAEPGGEAAEQSDIWVVDRTAAGWSEAHPVGPEVNSELSEYFPSVTSDGTMYFTRQGPQFPPTIFRARWTGDGYAEAERLPEQVNAGQARFNAHVARDESYLIVPMHGMEGALGGVDYYITFRNEDDTWTEPVNMGERVNHDAGEEWSACVSPDGKYLFFMAERDAVEEGFSGKGLKWSDLLRMSGEPGRNVSIYWIDAGFIEGLRPE